MRYITSLHLTQERFYCRLKKDGSGYSPRQPLGKNSIPNLFKSAAEKLGLKNVEHFRPHALRAFFITKLANSKNVSMGELMSASRHTSVSASMAYQARSSHSEANRVNTLLNLPSVQVYQTTEPPQVNREHSPLVDDNLIDCSPPAVMKRRRSSAKSETDMENDFVQCAHAAPSRHSYPPSFPSHAPFPPHISHTPSHFSGRNNSGFGGPNPHFFSNNTAVVPNRNNMMNAPMSDEAMEIRFLRHQVQQLREELNRKNEMLQFYCGSSASHNQWM